MDENKNKFQPSKRLFTTCVYIIVTTIISAAFIRAIWHWDSTTKFLSELMSNLSPFLGGFLIAYLMGNLSNSIERHFFINTLNLQKEKLRKGLSLLLSYVIVIALITGALFFIIPAVVDSVTDMAANITELYKSLIELLNSFEKKYPNPTVGYIQDYIQKSMPEYTASFSKWAASFAPSIATASYSAIKLILNIIVAIIVSIYMLLDKDILTRNLKRIIYSVFNLKKANYTWKTIEKANDIFSGFIIGKTIDSLIIGILCLILMKIFNVGGPYTLIISIFVGVTNMIPYFGPFIGAIPSIIIILLAVSPKEALIFSFLILALQQFDGNILGPYILGDKTGLRPIWIIFAITIGGWLGGVIGMFLGVPTVAVIASILEETLQQRLDKKGIDDLPSLNPLNIQSETKSILDTIKDKIKNADSDKNDDTSDGNK